jgi:ornithine cyclodeaminase
MSYVRDLDWIGIVGRNESRSAMLVESLSKAGLPAHVADSDAIGTSDIICTCTNSRDPVFDGRGLPATVHINAIGTHEPDARELDDHSFAGAAIVVEDRDVALREAGDIVLALASGAIPKSASLHQLRDLVARTDRIKGTGRTIFKSVGSAGQDLVVAEMLMGQFASSAREHLTGGRSSTLPRVTGTVEDGSEKEEP